MLAGAGLRAAITVTVITGLALATGHLLGGPERATRTAVAICSAARNPGLALVVVTRNALPPAVAATVLAYLAVSALVVLADVLWRRGAAGGALQVP
jgi:hypothetical protein